jgi:hypothetical protein
LTTDSNVKTEWLGELYLSGLSYKHIARQYGGTPDGVRSTIRKMRERGVLPTRQRIEWPVPR